MFYLFIYYYYFLGCVGSSSLCKGLLQLRQVGTTLHRGLSCHRAQASDEQAQQSWLMGPAAPRDAGSSQTRARTRVPPHRQADSQPLRYQGIPSTALCYNFFKVPVMQALNFITPLGSVFNPIYNIRGSWTAAGCKTGVLSLSGLRTLLLATIFKDAKEILFM